MVERYTPTPADQRESNNLSFGKYVKDVGPLLLYPIAGGALGYLGGKMKAPGFTGKSVFQKGMDWLYKRNKETAELVVEIEQGSSAYHASNITNWGFVGAIISAFTGWKKNEQNRLDLFDVNEGLQEAIAMVSDDASLEKGNRILEKQIDHLREKRGDVPLFKVAEVSAEGRAKEAASLEVS